MSRDTMKESISNALEENGVTPTDEMVMDIVNAVEMDREYDSYSEPRYHDCEVSEISRLKRELERERHKTICPECKGKGSVTDYWLDRMSTSSCNKCNGTGFIYNY